jgi:alpha-ketoglutarate-dependent taurine dioxygenase
MASSKTRWRSTELDLAAVTLTLSPAHLAAIDTLMEKVGPQHRRFDTIRKADFSHPALDADLAALRAEVMHGRGIVFIDGMPVDRYSVAEAESLFWGIGTHFGTGHSQSAAGDRMGHVADRTQDLGGKQSGRGYLSRRHLSPHTDLTEILGMLSVRTSPQGGESVFGSAMTMFDIIRREHPEYIPVYEQGFPYHRRNEEAAGAAPITPYNVPLYSVCDGVESCFYVRDIIDVAMRDLGRDYTPLERAALDFFEDVFSRDEVKLEFVMQPGQAVFLNNYEVLHGRRTFVDHPEPERKRLLFRLQLETGERPVKPEMFIYENRDNRHGIDAQHGKVAATPEFLVANAPQPA